MAEYPWYDTALTAYLTAFFLLEALMLRRESRLGWALTAKCLSLSALFTFALGFRLVEWVHARPEIGLVLRAGVALSVTWCIVELVRMRRAT